MSNLIHNFQSHPWAIRREALKGMIGLCESTNWSNRLAELESRRQSDGVEEQKRVAVLSLVGTITPDAGFFEFLFGGSTSPSAFANRYEAAIEDDSVESVIVKIDTPGGIVFGVEEASDQIFNLRGRKKVTGVITGEMASAGLHIGSAFDEVVIQPSAQAGSLGVFMMHVDMSKMLEEDGVDYTFIHAGKYKVAGNATEPLDDETRSYIQSMVDTYYDGFVAAVARNRGLTNKDVEADFGQGRMLLAQQAVDVGMVDRVGTFKEVLAEHLAPKKGTLNLAAARTRLDALSI